MRVAWLRLENYRRFALAELEFPDGVIGLVGPNGAGKSTLVEAIGWALFGHDAARTHKEHLPRRGAKGACRVGLRFELGGVEHEVTRELGPKGQHTATVLVGGRVAVAAGANSAKEATQFVERALRMDRDAFFTSLVTRQGELGALSGLNPARRKELVLRMLRIDAIDTAIDLARAEKRALQARIEGASGQRMDPVALAAAAKSFAAEQAAEEQALAKALEAAKGVEASLDAVGKARERAEEARVRHDALASRAAVLREKAAAAQRAADQSAAQLEQLLAVEAEGARLRPEADAYAPAKEAFDALEAARLRAEERARLEREVQQLQREAGELAEAHRRAALEAAAAPEARATLEQARAAAQKAHAAAAEARAQAGAADRAARDAREALALAERKRDQTAELGAEADCPMCGQALAEALPKLLAALDEDLAGQRARIAALDRRLAHLQEQARAAATALQQASQLEVEGRARAEALARREVEAEALLRRAGDAETRLGGKREALAALGHEPFDAAAHARLRERVQALDKARQRALQLQARLEARPALEAQGAAHQRDAAGATAQARAAEQERLALGYDPAARGELEERFRGLQQRSTALQVEAERRRGAAERLARDRARVEEEEQRQRALDAQLAAMRSEVVLLDRLAGDRDAGLLAEFRSRLMGRLRPALAERAGELFRACTDGRYAGLELNEDYDLLVLEEGQALPLARCSGGEQDLANLCLRIAVGEVLAERSGEALGFLALDEVLGSQDEQRRQNILGALARLRGRFRQILLITHIEEVKEALEHVVYVEDAGDGTARLGSGEPVPLAA